MITPDQWSLWSNVFFLIPTIVCIYKQIWLEMTQVLALFFASTLMHYKFEEKVLGMSNIQRFLWDYLSSIMLVYSSITYVVSMDNQNAVATFVLMNILILLCDIMVSKNLWGGLEHNLCIAFAVLFSFAQFNVALYYWQWVQAAAIVCVILAAILLFCFYDYPMVHGVWHMMAALAATFAYLNDSGKHNYLF
jgi:hypothetical protein